MILFAGETAVVGISTGNADYFLRSASLEYKEVMNNLYEKMKMLKLVYDILDKQRANNCLRAFFYKDLMEEISVNSPLYGFLDYSEDLIIRYGHFVLTQVRF